LTPRYCGLFDILAKVGLVAYCLDLTPTIKLHDIFHVSILKKHMQDATHVIDCSFIKVEPKGEFHMGPECILDRRVFLLSNRTIG